MTKRQILIENIKRMTNEHLDGPLPHLDAQTLRKASLMMGLIGEDVVRPSKLKGVDSKAAKALIARALNGDKDAEGALYAVSGEFLIAGKPLPNSLSRFIANRLFLLGGE